MANDTIHSLGYSAARGYASGVRSSVKNQGDSSADFRAQLNSVSNNPAGKAQNSPQAGQKLPPASQEEEAMDSQAVSEAIKEMKSYLQNVQRDLQFEVDLDAGHTVISVVDRETKEVIRQIPREEVVERARRLEQEGDSKGNQGGLLLEVQA